MTGWNEGESITAVGKCFVAWLDGFGGTGNREERALLTQVTGFLEKNGASRFQNILNKDEHIINRAGFFRVVDHDQREYLVLPQAFKLEVCSGYDLKYAIKILRDRGWLLPGNGKSAQKTRLPGLGDVRTYVISAKMWSDE